MIGLQIASPSRFTSTAGPWLAKIFGGSAFTPSAFFGRIWLLSTVASTRSSAITRSWSGIEATTSATTSRTSSFLSVGKLDSVTFSTEKLTSRSETATLVSASTLRLPRAGFEAPFIS